jgi:hypothetical protein
MRGLGAGGDEEECDTKLDLMEVIASILVIPTLPKAAYDGGDLPAELVKPAREGLIVVARLRWIA